MRFINFNLSALRLVRFLVAACVCVLLVFSHAFPAYSESGNISPQPTSNQNSPQQGEANLLDIEKEAQEATQEKPYSREETQNKANPGLNEIQGTADIGNMSRPENAKGNSVEDKSKDFLEALTGRK
jgi:hypothetical protein